MTLAEAMLAEFNHEAATTRRVLERVPGDRLAWRPHAKSMSLGQLALHIAAAPAQVAGMCVEDRIEFPEMGESPSPENVAAVLQAHDDGAVRAQEIVGSFDDARMAALYTVEMGGKEVMAMPRAMFLRAVMLNHVYHHRGQLTVYLRMLDIPVPSVYGPSADEGPNFG